MVKNRAAEERSGQHCLTIIILAIMAVSLISPRWFYKKAITGMNNVFFGFE
jgi:hypothetical protein